MEQEELTHVVYCPYCGEEAEYLSSKAFYGRDYGSNIYLCRDCDAYVGTHKGSSKALGTMATYELRELRKKAHAAFDPLWKIMEMSRRQAYKWLQEVMGLSAEEAHIGLFNKAKCKSLIRKIKER